MTIRRIIPSVLVSMPHAALWVVQLEEVDKILKMKRFQCRTRLCGWCNLIAASTSVAVIPVSMPHAALWVVQHLFETRTGKPIEVSMPHAALWVVQRLSWKFARLFFSRFNAARGFVGGATIPLIGSQRSLILFQCRTRLCGWCNHRERRMCPAAMSHSVFRSPARV